MTHFLNDTDKKALSNLFAQMIGHSRPEAYLTFSVVPNGPREIRYAEEHETRDGEHLWRL